MKRIASNVCTGRICVVNVSLASAGLLATLFTSGTHRIFAAGFLGVYIFTQSLLALRDMRKRGL